MYVSLCICFNCFVLNVVVYFVDVSTLYVLRIFFRSLLASSSHLACSLTHLTQRLIEHELEGFGIRLNKKAPNLTFRKKERGGLNFTATVPLSHLNHDVVKSILSEYKVHNADVCLREDCTADELIDVIEGNRRYIPCLYILNKVDQITMEELEIMCRVPNTVPISAYKVGRVCVCFFLPPQREGVLATVRLPLFRFA
jgi:C-terminal region of MMR_HSR1 domain